MLQNRPEKVPKVFVHNLKFWWNFKIEATKRNFEPKIGGFMRKNLVPFRTHQNTHFLKAAREKAFPSALHNSRDLGDELFVKYFFSLANSSSMGFKSGNGKFLRTWSSSSGVFLVMSVMMLINWLLLRPDSRVSKLIARLPAFNERSSYFNRLVGVCGDAGISSNSLFFGVLLKTMGEVLFSFFSGDGDKRLKWWEEIFFVGVFIGDDFLMGDQQTFWGNFLRPRCLMTISSGDGLELPNVSTKELYIELNWLVGVKTRSSEIWMGIEVFRSGSPMPLGLKCNSSRILCISSSVTAALRVKRRSI